MIQLFIFNEISRAAIYGIGTYIRQLIACLDDEFQINIVNYYSDKPEFTLVENNKTRELVVKNYNIYAVPMISHLAAFAMDLVKIAKPT